MSLNDSVWPVEQGSNMYQHQLATLCLNENRAAMIIYYYMSIPSGINLDLCWMHPEITEIEKTISVFMGGLNLQPCPWNINLVIYWYANNLSHQGVTIQLGLLGITLSWVTYFGSLLSSYKTEKKVLIIYKPYLLV